MHAKGSATTPQQPHRIPAMGIFSRLTDIINSNINAILDRAEEPEKIIRLIIQEMEDTLVEVRSSAVRTIAERRELERRIGALRHDLEEWQRKAEFALSKEREDLAKAALLAKNRIADSLKQQERQLAEMQAALQKQNEDVGKLEAKLKDAKAREKTIVARQKSAVARLKVRAKLYDERVGDAFSRFEQVERALDELEGKVESYDLGRKPTAVDELNRLEADATVERELAELKKRMSRPGQQGA
jgi:phage shock protein A